MYNVLPFHVRSRIVSQKVVLSFTVNFWLIFTLVFKFMVNPDPNLNSELDPAQECILLSVPLRQQVAVPGVPVPQHGPAPILN